MSRAVGAGKDGRSKPPAISQAQKDRQQPSDEFIHKYKGFAAGVLSGVTKCTVGHPFDTIKVRLQTSPDVQFKGPLDCVLQTIRKEGFSGMYKGMTPPLVGWMFMDSLMLGSLTAYRRVLNQHVFNRDAALAFHVTSSASTNEASLPKLPPFGHGIAGIFAGCTVSFIAAPIEHVKARLQVQYSADKAKRLYSGPVHCARSLLQNHGVRGLYHGLSATLLFRSFFFFWWSSYDIISNRLSAHTSLSAPAVNFWAGGLSAQIFWLTSYPSDVVKQRIMTDGLGSNRKFRRWKDAAREVWMERGVRGFWRGFVPCALRAFPANAMALVAFEGVMRALP